MAVARSAGIFVRILFPLVLGILMFYGKAFVLETAIVCLMLISCLISINVFYIRLHAYRHKGIVGLLFYLFIFSCGALLVMTNDQSLAKDYFANKQYRYMKVTVNEEPRLKNSVLKFKTRVRYCYDEISSSGIRSSGTLMVAVLVDSLNKLNISYGDELILPYRISPIKPSISTSGFDYKAWLAAQNIYHHTILKQDELLKLKTGSGNRLVAFALNMRKEQVAYYRTIIKNDEAFAVATTLILGYRADLDKATLSIYSRTGTIHALSVSGMHVGLVYLVLNWLLSMMSHSKWTSVVKMLIILTCIWFYALLTGFSPSVLRSVIMLSIFIVSKSFNKSTNSYNIIAFAALSLLIYDPFLIWDIGFQLSFLAVFGLVWIQPMIQNWWHIKQDWLYKIWGVIAMSLSAQLTTFPFSIYYFHQFPVYFLIGNLFIILPIALLMYLGIFILIFRISTLGPLFEWLISFTNSGLAVIAELPFSSLADIRISKFELTVLCIMIGLFVLACSEFKKQLLFAFLICFVVLQSSITYRKLKKNKAEKNCKLNVYLKPK